MRSEEEIKSLKEDLEKEKEQALIYQKPSPLKIKISLLKWVLNEGDKK